MKRVTGFRRGFTLWEMAMVLVILAVLASVAVPAYVTFGADRKRKASEMVMDLINDSRRAAIRHGVVATLLIDPSSGHFRLDTAGTDGLGVVLEDSLELGVGETLETDLPRLRYQFRPIGAAFGDSVVVRGVDVTELITVDRWSGVARAYIR